MRRIVIRLRQADLSRAMEEMRAWLDQSGFSPRKFDCHQHEDAVVVCVEFMVAAEGEAFAARFGGGAVLAELMSDPK